jgi:hypothetical protein
MKVDLLPQLFLGIEEVTLSLGCKWTRSRPDSSHVAGALGKLRQPMPRNFLGNTTLCQAAIGTFVM